MIAGKTAAAVVATPTLRRKLRRDETVLAMYEEEGIGGEFLIGLASF
jgi:hypothetical protein